MSRRVRRPLEGVTQAPAVTTIRISTRLRPSRKDMVVLAPLGQHFGRLQGKDLAGRCEAGKSHDKVLWAARKQVLTSDCSSRWAGWVLTDAFDDHVHVTQSEDGDGPRPNDRSSPLCGTRRRRDQARHWGAGPWSLSLVPAFSTPA